MITNNFDELMNKIEKIYVLDTNVLINDPLAFNQFGENNLIVVPITVINELDRNKKGMTNKGVNARRASREIDKLSEQMFEDGKNFVHLENGGYFCMLNIHSVCDVSEIAKDEMYNDNLIVQSAVYFQERCECVNTQISVVFVSNDANARIDARAKGIKAETYKAEESKSDNIYDNLEYIDLSQYPDLISKLYEENGIHINHLKAYPQLNIEIYKNKPLVVIAEGKKIYCICSNEAIHVKHFKSIKQLGISPRNDEQKYFMDAINNNDIKVISCISKAGVGKSICAIASCLELVQKNKFDKLLIYKPYISTAEQELGFLPQSGLSL